jgi:ArsR family transcriptional regulator, lead/cadmium/zinc/bismuth-responsive transcriptional repressor
MLDDDRCEVLSVHQERVNAARSTLPGAEERSRVAGYLRLLGDQTRITILCALDGRELCVCDLTVLLGLSQSAVSHQLALLRAGGLVRVRRDGKVAWYTLVDPSLHLLLKLVIRHD